MTERQVLFSAPMVRAILNGSKTQTRRVVKGFLPSRPEYDEERGVWEFYNGDMAVATLRCPYGQPGDKLWVREAWARAGDRTIYRADAQTALMDGFGGWRPSIHMPRWASRITLEVVSVRVERLQDISEADAMAEGAPPSHSSIDKISREFGYPDFPRSWFAQLWDSIHGPGSWDANPFVWTVSFTKLEGRNG